MQAQVSSSAAIDGGRILWSLIAGAAICIALATGAILAGRLPSGTPATGAMPANIRPAADGQTPPLPGHAATRTSAASSSVARDSSSITDAVPDTWGAQQAQPGSMPSLPLVDDTWATANAAQ